MVGAENRSRDDDAARVRIEMEIRATVAKVAKRSVGAANEVVA